MTRTRRSHHRRSGRCVCGALVALHFDARNNKLSCEETARRSGWERPSFADTLRRLAASRQEV